MPGLVAPLIWPAILTADATSGDIATLTQYGVLGVIAGMLILFARNAHQRERDRADRMEAENKRLNELILDRVIPALTSATRAAEETGELLNALQRERQLAQVAEVQRRHPKGGTG